MVSHQVPVGRPSGAQDLLGAQRPAVASAGHWLAGLAVPTDPAMAGVGVGAVERTLPVLPTGRPSTALGRSVHVRGYARSGGMHRRRAGAARRSRAGVQPAGAPRDGCRAGAGAAGRTAARLRRPVRPARRVGVEAHRTETHETLAGRADGGRSARPLWPDCEGEPLVILVGASPT